MYIFRILSCFLLVNLCNFAFSQEVQIASSNNDLEEEIMEMDHLLFDVAFNNCDLETYKKLTSEDFEFYDDRSGLNKSIEIEIKSFEDRCSRQFAVTRKLISSEVHVLGNYGALQIGEHEFYEDEKRVETSKFITIWERTENSWIMRRAISFEHRAVVDGLNVNENKAYEFRENYKQILDDLVPGLLKKFNAPAAGIGVIKDGNIDLIKVFGEHQIGSKAPTDTIFNVASITKPVVATAVLKLVEMGEWDLDEPLYHYFTDPDVIDDSRSKLITTRHCLSHTTGFKNWRREEDDGKLKFDFEPGTRFQYSGEGMEYLRHALESKFGKGLDDIVNELVFEPLRMADATLGWIPEEKIGRFAFWYNTKGKVYERSHETPNINAADDLLLTVKDMLLFGNAIMNIDLVKGPFYKEMTNPQVAINNKIDQGLGWVIYDQLSSGETILNHDGGDAGVVATLILMPERKNGIVIFVNSDNGASVTNSIIDNILYNGMDVTESLHWDNSIPKKIKLSRVELEKYSGTYSTDHGFSITFSVDGSNLITDSDVFPRVELYPSSKNEFFPIPFEVYFNFVETGDEMKVELLTSDRKVDLTGFRQ